MNLVERYNKIMIRNQRERNIYISGQCVGQGQAVVVDACTANTFLGNLEGPIYFTPGRKIVFTVGPVSVSISRTKGTEE